MPSRAAESCFAPPPHLARISYNTAMAEILALPLQLEDNGNLLSMHKLRSVAVAFASCGVFVVACGTSSNKPPPGAEGTFDSGRIDGSQTNPEEDGGGDDGGVDGDASSSKCRNTVKDGDETDIDCGGSCEPCDLGKGCAAKADCSGGAECENKVCALCHDNVTNGDETDVDCGGKACGPCTVGKRCARALDCRSESCKAEACACPPNMTIVALASGGAYCIDQAEVSKGQYNKFVTANVPVTDQTGACLGANDSFVPRNAWPPAEAPATLEFNFGMPVHYVDWCDAVAYCKWAKKQLCGNVNGTSLAPADANDASKSAWFNACSAQAANAFPYGATFEDRCNGDGMGKTGIPVNPDTYNTRGAAFGFSVNADDGIYHVASSDMAGNVSGATHKVCAGGSPGIYQMSGNVAEWEDSCDGSVANSACRVRGGSYLSANNQAALRCDASRSVTRLPTNAEDLKDIGIRCCVY